MPGARLGRGWLWHPGTLAIGSVGGAAFAALDLPLAWMLGAMTATTGLAMVGAPIRVDGRLRMVMVTVLGIMLGSVFTPDILDQAVQWLPMLLALVLYLVVLTAFAFAYCRIVAGYDRPTAFFSGAPGGLSEMVLMGPLHGGDARTISLMHGARILFVVMTLPVLLGLILGGYDTPSGLPGSAIGAEPRDLAILAGCAVLGYLGAKAVRLPAAALTGPMLLSAAVHLTGITAASPPELAVIVAQVVIGSAIGSRFAGTPPAFLRGVLLRSLGLTVVMLMITFLAAWIVSDLTGLAWEACVLALAPGGLAEMSLIALALDIDPAFVSFNHVVRILLVVILFPPLYRLMTGAPPVDRDAKRL